MYISSMRLQLLNRIIKKIFRISHLMFLVITNEKDFSAILRWSYDSYCSPSPYSIKQSVVLRNMLPNATSVETGTYLGGTTELLATNSSNVISIEPEENLFKLARLKFANSPNIRIINGTSEDVFPEIIPSLKGEISFWLDGHFSAGITFKGKKSTPIIDELSIIESQLSNFSKVVIMIDDVRCFDPTIPDYADYPTRTYLVDWANRNQLSWTIEHDIFIIKSFK
jgi:hypothetical protein